jgi:hypothetical protein
VTTPVSEEAEIVWFSSIESATNKISPELDVMVPEFVMELPWIDIGPAMLAEKDVKVMAVSSFDRPSSNPPKLDESDRPWAFVGNSVKLVEPAAGKIFRVPVEETAVDKLPKEVMRFPTSSILAVEVVTRLPLHVATAQAPKVTPPCV